MRFSAQACSQCRFSESPGGAHERHRWRWCRQVRAQRAGPLLGLRCAGSAAADAPPGPRVPGGLPAAAEPVKRAMPSRWECCPTLGKISVETSRVNSRGCGCPKRRGDVHWRPSVLWHALSPGTMKTNIVLVGGRGGGGKVDKALQRGAKLWTLFRCRLQDAAPGPEMSLKAVQPPRHKYSSLPGSQARDEGKETKLPKAHLSCLLELLPMLLTHGLNLQCSLT